jgi:hypothetical protein
VLEGALSISTRDRRKPARRLGRGFPEFRLRPLHPTGLWNLVGECPYGAPRGKGGRPARSVVLPRGGREGGRVRPPDPEPLRSIGERAGHVDLGREGERGTHGRPPSTTNGRLAPQAGQEVRTQSLGAGATPTTSPTAVAQFRCVVLAEVFRMVRLIRNTVPHTQLRGIVDCSRAPENRYS